MVRSTDTIWTELYRPQKIEDCILQADIKNLFSEIIRTNKESGEFPNLILTGSAGTGKTTVAKALCKELSLDYIFINGSESGNIDTLRTTIRQFASTMSLNGGLKIVILDEADGLNPQSTQPALRAFIEEFSKTCRFVLTCNFKNKIIEPLHSRCTCIDFRIQSKDKPILAQEFLRRLKYILDLENVKYQEKVLVDLIVKFFPDYRKIINHVQRYSIATNRNIDEGILSDFKEISLKKLVASMKAKNFTDVRKWVANNADGDQARIFREIYDNLSLILQPKSIPQAIVILGEYQYKAAFVADHEINLTSCLVELMMNCEFAA